ncbi:MAG: CHRD domain-containing protein [Planctomycetota bacterium]
MATLPLAFLLSGAAQAQTFQFGLDGTQEVPPVSTPGSGTCTVTLDTASGQVQVNGTYEGLTAPASAAHIHGPAPTGASAGIVLGLSVSGGTTGTISGGGQLSQVQIQDLLTGLHYVNIHSAAFPNGETRGQVTAEPTTVPYGGNPTDSLTPLAGTPSIGTTTELGIDNPTGTQATGSLPFLAVSTTPDPLFTASGTGVQIPGWGMDGGPGELLISTAPPDPTTTLTGPPWTGPGNPSPTPLAIPNEPALLGRSLFTQGTLLDPTGTGPTIGLTNGVETTIGQTTTPGTGQ